MRTPGQDRHLAAGFLLSEQIVRAPGDIAAMRYCTDTDSRDTVNVLNYEVNLIWQTAAVVAGGIGLYYFGRRQKAR